MEKNDRISWAELIARLIYIGVNIYAWYWAYKFEVAYYHQFGTLLPW